MAVDGRCSVNIIIVGTFVFLIREKDFICWCFVISWRSRISLVGVLVRFFLFASALRFSFLYLLFGLW